MEKEDQLMFFAGMALVGLASQERHPDVAAQVAWQYAEAMLKIKSRNEKGNE